MRLLVMRGEPGASETASALRDHGHEPIVAPLFRLEILSEVDAADGPWDAILLTSFNALGGATALASSDHCRRLPVFAVGERTAQAARELGFTNVASAAGDVHDLAGLVAARLTLPARLLYLAGEQRAGDLAGALRTKGFAVDTVQVYRIVAAEMLPPKAVATLTGEIDGVLHYSRHSAEEFLTAARHSGLLDAALSKPVHYCLSPRVAEPLRAAGARDVRAAERPNEASLFALLSAD